MLLWPWTKQAPKIQGYSGYADSHLLDDPVAEVSESWLARLGKSIRGLFATSKRPLTDLEDKFQDEARRLLGAVRERDREIQDLRNEVDFLKGKQQLDQRFIDSLNEIIEGLRQHREVDMIAHAKFVAVADTYLKSIVGGGVSGNHY